MALFYASFDHHLPQVTESVVPATRPRPTTLQKSASDANGCRNCANHGPYKKCDADSMRRSQSDFGPSTDEPFLCHGPTSGERGTGAAGEDLAQLCDFQDVLGSENDLSLSPACMGEASTCRTVAEP